MENPIAPHSLQQQLEAEALNSHLGWCPSRAILREVDFTLAECELWSSEVFRACWLGRAGLGGQSCRQGSVSVHPLPLPLSLQLCPL